MQGVLRIYGSVVYWPYLYLSTKKLPVCSKWPLGVFLCSKCLHNLIGDSLVPSQQQKTRCLPESKNIRNKINTLKQNVLQFELHIGCYAQLLSRVLDISYSETTKAGKNAKCPRNMVKISVKYVISFTNFRKVL